MKIYDYLRYNRYTFKGKRRLFMNRRQRFSLRKYKFGLASQFYWELYNFEQVKSVPREQSTGENQAQTQQSRQS